MEVLTTCDRSSLYVMLCYLNCSQLHTSNMLQLVIKYTALVYKP